MFKSMPYRQTVGLALVTTLVITLLITMDHFGVITRYVPEDSLIYSSLILLLVIFFAMLIIVGVRATRVIDKNVQEFCKIRHSLDDDIHTDKYEKVARLFSGEVVDRGTISGRFIRRLAQAKLKNHRFALNFDSYKVELGNELYRYVSWLNFMAGMMVALGMLGTFIGIVVGFQQLDFSKLGDLTDITAIFGMLDGLKHGLSTAFLTSLVGLFTGSVVLAYVAKTLKFAVQDLVSSFAVQYRTHLDPLINDEKEMKIVFSYMKKRDYQTFVGCELENDDGTSSGG